MPLPISRNPAASPHPTRQEGFVRMVGESVIILAMAVTLFRAFFAEGYMISTGSMAPTLLGYHRRLCCPACQFEFERGASTRSDDPADVSASEAANPWRPVAARCPNCGSAVSLDDAPRTEGDQLLVHKHHYALRDPGRWEVAVFRNPQLPMQAYVKRVAGLPGETIELIDGNLYADGVLQRKPLSVQTALRIPVSDDDHIADGPDARPRWEPAAPNSQWRKSMHGSLYAISASEGERECDWIQYRHWIRSGGNHLCRVPLDAWPHTVPEPGQLRDGFRFLPKEHALESIGAMPAELRDEWLARLDDSPARLAVAHLYERSHQPPVLDLCAYNHPDAADEHFQVHELMLELQLTPHEMDGEFVLSLHDGCHELQCTFDLAAGEARLTADDDAYVHRRGSLAGLVSAGESVTVLMSLFDRQAVVAVNGQELFAPLLYSGEGTRPPLPRHPAKLGAAGANLTVASIRLYRDVYYTPPDEHEDRSWKLGDDEFFVLGDNSPVSLDSRAWDDPAVPRRMLIGRPFVVHLPSRQQKIPWKGREVTLRVPDFSRVRYIR
jgi:signal peptidase I